MSDELDADDVMAEWEQQLLMAYSGITREELDELLAEIADQERKEHDELMDREIW